MSKKLQKRLYRVIVVLMAFILLLVAEHKGFLAVLGTPVCLCLYLVPYFGIAYDVLVKAANMPYNKIAVPMTGRQGVNIMVTRYSDGTTSSCKIVK